MFKSTAQVATASTRSTRFPATTPRTRNTASLPIVARAIASMLVSAACVLHVPGKELPSSDELAVSDDFCGTADEGAAGEATAGAAGAAGGGTGVTAPAGDGVWPEVAALKARAA